MVLPDGQFRLMFTAQDYASAVAFYGHGLELPLDHDWDLGPGDAGSVFKAGGGMVESSGPPQARLMWPRRASHAFQVDDVDKWLILARERGLDISKSPRPNRGANAPFASAIPMVSRSPCSTSSSRMPPDELCPPHRGNILEMSALP